MTTHCTLIDAERGEAHHQRVERVLAANEPAVEEREPRHHEHHERGGDQHPRGVARGDVGGVHALTPVASACALRCTSSAVTGVSAALSRLAGADAHDALERLHEDLAVADFARARGVDDRLDRRLDERLRARHLDLHLVAELEHDGRAAIVLDDLALAAVAAHATERHAGDAGPEERFLDRREALGADDAGDELHESLPGMNEKRPGSAGAVMVFSVYGLPEIGVKRIARDHATLAGIRT